MYVESLWCTPETWNVNHETWNCKSTIFQWNVLWIKSKCPPVTWLKEKASENKYKSYVHSLYILHKLLTKHYKLLSTAILCSISLDRSIIYSSSLLFNQQRCCRPGCSVQPPATTRRYSFRFCHFMFRVRKDKMMAKFLFTPLNSTFLAMIKEALTSMVSKTIKLLILILTTFQVHFRKMKTVVKNQQFFFNAQMK